MRLTYRGIVLKDAKVIRHAVSRGRRFVKHTLTVRGKPCKPR